MLSSQSLEAPRPVQLMTRSALPSLRWLSAVEMVLAKEAEEGRDAVTVFAPRDVALVSR